MTELSPEQMVIANLPLSPFCVTACAGSGKTRTAVHRLRRMRKLLEDKNGFVALLSFSNVAVDTFRRDYFDLTRSEAVSTQPSAVEIDTVDGFITTNILRPHAHRTMKAPRTAFLVHGTEPFLKGFTVSDGKRPHPTSSLRVSISGGKFSFEGGPTYAPVAFAANDAERAIERLGKTGAYTHSSGRYWAIRTMREQPFVLRGLARRYPHVLIDEAQDIGFEHQAILEELIRNGVELSLIGDKHQGIYEFSGANGKFLEEYASRNGVDARRLTVNYRSVPRILSVANELSGRKDTANRNPPDRLNGAFYLPFKKGERDETLATFQSMMASAGVEPNNAVVVCRSTNWVEQWRGGQDEQGQGVVKAFVDATVYRDKLRMYAEAFDRASRGIIALLADEHGDLTSILARGTPRALARPLRQIIWSFVRDPSSGLPGGSLLAKTEWHPLLKDRLMTLLARLDTEFGIKSAENLGNKLANKALLNKPISQLPDLASAQAAPIPVTTVHQVKGESIEAVMYAADRGQIRELLDGTRTEVGRIGYVAVTRACNLFVLAVPESCIAEFESELLACGFQKPGTSQD